MENHKLESFHKLVHINQLGNIFDIDIHFQGYHLQQIMKNLDEILELLLLKKMVF